MLKIISTLLSYSLFTLVVRCVPTGPNTIALSSGATRHEGAMTEVTIDYCGGLDDPTIETTGDEEVGPGFWVINRDNSPEAKYFLYENSRDEHPWKYLSIPQGHTAFVSVCDTWQGRIVRGTPEINLDGKVHNLGTWFASSIGPNGWMWGDISFLEGCDGGGSVASTDFSYDVRECFEDLLTGAPSSALATKETGTKVLGKLVGDAPNQEANHWELSKCSADNVWINGSDYRPIIKSTNGRLQFIFFKGQA
ncbi:hypothetical protein F5Y12DRAFT_712058 [Xylaria sp. FL1777]|nr:hypothetical protein F5Y12DRAFT_712058 [Xylaria sp. FL1777]